MYETLTDLALDLVGEVRELRYGSYNKPIFEQIRAILSQIEHEIKEKP